MLFQLGITLRRVANHGTTSQEEKDARITESIDKLKRAADLQPSEASAWNNLGLSYFEAEDFQAANDSYTTAINKENAEVRENHGSEENLSFYYKNRGLAYYHQGEMAEAKRDYDDAIRLNPHNADNYFNRGNVFLNQSEFDEAHADFDRAIDLENENAKLYHAKGLAFQAQAEALARS